MSEPIDHSHELFALDLAVETYFMRREGREDPRGHYDAPGNWYPDRLLEERGCCEAIQPHSLNRHCQSITHIANMYRIRPAVLRRQLQVILQLDSNADWKRLSRQRLHRLNRAVHTYLLRNSQPKFPRATLDARGRWSQEHVLERRSCCESIEGRLLEHHWRSITHVANVHGIEARVLRRKLCDIHQSEFNRHARWKYLTMNRRQNCDNAADTYLRRKSGDDHPHGFVDEGRWYPHPKYERRYCCARVRQDSLKRHCRSIVHVANLYDVNLPALRKQLYRIRAGLEISPREQYELMRAERNARTEARRKLYAQLRPQPREQAEPRLPVGYAGIQPGKLPFRRDSEIDTSDIDQLPSEIETITI